MLSQLNDRSAARLMNDGPILLDTIGRLRFWATTWALFLPANLAESTIRKKLAAIESFYRHTDEISWPGRLDDALAHCDERFLSDALEAYFISFRNRSMVSSSSDDRWQAALQFVIETLQRLVRSHTRKDQVAELRNRLAQLELLHASLHVGRPRRLAQIHSLPSEAVEYLYESLDPQSKMNPFKGARTRWRVLATPAGKLVFPDGPDLSQGHNKPKETVLDGGMSKLLKLYEGYREIRSELDHLNALPRGEVKPFQLTDHAEFVEK